MGKNEAVLRATQGRWITHAIKATSAVLRQSGVVDKQDGGTAARLCSAELNGVQ